MQLETVVVAELHLKRKKKFQIDNSCNALFNSCITNSIFQNNLSRCSESKIKSPTKVLLLALEKQYLMFQNMVRLKIITVGDSLHQNWYRLKEGKK